jgi:hypothetical protein
VQPRVLCSLRAIAKAFSAGTKRIFVDRHAAPAKELLLAGVGAALEAIGIEVDDDAADFAAGGR